MNLLRTWNQERVKTEEIVGVLLLVWLTGRVC